MAVSVHTNQPHEVKRLAFRVTNTDKTTETTRWPTARGGDDSEVVLVSEGKRRLHGGMESGVLHLWPSGQSCLKLTPTEVGVRGDAQSRNPRMSQQLCLALLYQQWIVALEVRRWDGWMDGWRDD